MGRIEIELGRDAAVARGRATGCGRVFGIANFSYAGRGPHDFDAAGGGHPARPRRSRDADRSASASRRADKRFPFTSPQIEREVGGLIKEANGLARRSRAIRR